MPHPASLQSLPERALHSPSPIACRGPGRDASPGQHDDDGHPFPLRVSHLLRIDGGSGFFFPFLCWAPTSVMRDLEPSNRDIGDQGLA